MGPDSDETAKPVERWSLNRVSVFERNYLRDSGG